MFERHLFDPGFQNPENRHSTRFLVKKSRFARSRYITSVAVTRLTRTDGRFLPENRGSSRTNGILTNDRPAEEEATSQIDRSIALPSSLLSFSFVEERLPR